MIKVIVLACLVAAAVAQHYGGYGQQSHGYDHQDYHAPAHYNFEYSVHDPHTGDIKSQHETREGDVVKGYYTLKEADGTIREVHYTADKKNGFNAQVIRKGHAYHQDSYKSYGGQQNYGGHQSYGHQQISLGGGYGNNYKQSYGGQQSYGHSGGHSSQSIQINHGHGGYGKY